MESLIVFLYSLTPFLTSAAYLPQIHKLLKSSPAEIRSLSLWAWFIWTGCSFVSLLYGLVRLHDTLFCVVAAISFLWCALIVGIALYKRRAL